MPQQDRKRGGGGNYFLGFLGTATLLVSGTLILVLYVLPQRYVLSSGFREGGVGLPNPTTPFEPFDAPVVAPRPLPPPAEPTVIAEGPSEAFWNQVLPLLNAGRWAESLPMFVSYLRQYPGDTGVRREYAITLTKAGRNDLAIPEFRRLVSGGADFDLILMFARTLRDQGLVREAGDQYQHLVSVRPDDASLVLEWARALAWGEDYDEAILVLENGLRSHPDSIPLTVELARYLYLSGDLIAADDMLKTLRREQVEAAGAGDLLTALESELAEPEPDPDEPVAEPPSTLDLAIAAREEGNEEVAAELFRRALAETPGDARAWEAYANFLQFEQEDFAGALEALEEVERLAGGGPPGLQFRMAQLEVWTNDTDAAESRLESLLASDELATAGPEQPNRAEVLALLGDLDRWSGSYATAKQRYEAALRAQPDHGRAIEGLNIIRDNVRARVDEVERPRVGGLSRALGDTDEYLRLDVGGEYVDTHDTWAWGGQAGGRRIEGFGLTGALGDRQGAYAELELARWWQLGRVRTATQLGVETTRPGATDLAVGFAVSFLGELGRRTDVVLERAPAHMTSRTLQSLEAAVVQQRIGLDFATPFGSGWSFAATGDVARLEHRNVGGDTNLRVGGGASIGRGVARSLTLGVSGRLLHYSDAAGTGVPLYWDPEYSIAFGPYAQFGRSLSDRWEATARLSPGISLIEERRVAGREYAPDISASLGLRRRGGTYDSTIELLFGQGRFSGYRSFGLNLSLSRVGGFQVPR